MEEDGANITNRNINSLGYVIVIIAGSPKTLQRIIHKIKETGYQNGIQITATNTNIMIVSGIPTKADISKYDTKTKRSFLSWISLNLVIGCVQEKYSLVSYINITPRI